ncbi:hypothetical protein RJ640_020115 [Escallonia rubra]|uniref:Uncharacterized protein n=1 Tax=Escallonia rubra TaxID=112253 RepID=A0AA88QZR9_9ASTE|nr:hypothetical protein RJ640_020115 [Escallonia rubra]
MAKYPSLFLDDVVVPTFESPSGETAAPTEVGDAISLGEKAFDLGMLLHLRMACLCSLVLHFPFDVPPVLYRPQRLINGYVFLHPLEGSRVDKNESGNEPPRKRKTSPLVRMGYISIRYKRQSHDGQKSLAWSRCINSEGLRWRAFDAKGQGGWHHKYLLLFKAKTSPHTHLISIMEICALCLMLRMYVSQGGNLLTSFIDGILGKYIGHLKDRSFKDQMAKDPTEVIMHLLNLLKLSLDRDRNLRKFAGSEHPFHDRPIEPYVIPPRQV